MSADTNTSPKQKGGWWSLSPLAVFLCLYLITSLLINDFYKVPITVAFLLSSCYAIAITRGLKLEQRIYQFSVGAGNKNILLMIWIFVLAGAFAQSAKQMGAIDATVNLTLHILPDNLLLAGIFIAACFISLSIGTSVGTIVALTPVAVGLAEKTGIDLPYMTAIVVGGSFFGDNLSFISDTTIASTKTQDCVMRDKFKINFMIVVPAALVVLGIYVIQGLSLSAVPQIYEIEWIKVIPYLIVLGTAITGVNVMVVLLLGIVSTGIIGICTATGVFDVTPAENMNASTAFFDWFGAMGTGITGMGELIIITLLAGGMLETIRYNGGIDFVITRLTRHVTGKRGIQYSRTGECSQSLHRQQHHCHHHHRSHRQRHSQTLSPGPPENSKHTGYIFLSHSGHYPLRRTNADSRRTGGHLAAQHHRQSVLPVLHGSLRHTRHINKVSGKILIVLPGHRLYSERRSVYKTIVTADYVIIFGY
mgnify:FL=1